MTHLQFGKFVMKLRGGVAFLVICGTASIAAASVSPEGDFIDRFGGNWAGSGTVSKGAVSLHVNCRASGQPAPNKLVIEGNCSLAIASVRIAADISYDPASGRYTGTYIGAKVGTARVSGKRSGNVVNLAVTWPKPVNGDTNARMRIENAGGGSLRIVVSDNLEPGGPVQPTSDLVLSQL